MLGVVSGKLQFLPLKQTQHFRKFAIYDFVATLSYDREEDVWVVEDKTSLTTAAGGIAVVVLIAATASR